MKLMISTPCFGGQLTNSYVGSLMHCLGAAMRDGLLTDWQILMEGKESLIPRGRNRDALTFLESEFDKLLTIDADIEWTYEDFKRILSSDRNIVGGIYPLKGFPLVANFNPLPDKGTEFIKSNRGLDLDALEQFAAKYANPRTGEAEVRHVPTGFMCVNRKVLSKLSETVDVYWTFQPDSGARKGYFNFYPCGPHGNEFESEDWGFCRIARAAGFGVYVNTKIRLGHMGTHVYRMGQFFGQAGAGVVNGAASPESSA